MSKCELIEAIRQLNSTATVDFLTQFDDQELKEYMSHLLEVDAMNLTASVPSVPYN